MVRSGALAGGTLGLVFLADPRWAIPSAALAVAFGLRVLLVEHDPGRERTRAALTLLGLGGGSALAISAGLALPLAEYVSLTTRAAMTPAEANALALPASRLLGYLIPDIGGSPEWMTYVGIGVLYLAMLAVVSRGRGAWFWLGVAALSTLLALGDNLPIVWTVIRWMPGAGLLRVPARFLLISAFSLAVLAGMGAQTLLRPRTEESLAPRLRLITLGFGSLVALLAGGIYLVATRVGNPRLESSAALAAVTAVAVGAWVLVGLSGRLAVRTIGIGLALLLLAELSVVNRFELELRPAEAVLNERQDLARQAGQLAAGQRIFSPSYSLPQQTAERDRLELADGVGPLQLRSYRDSMAQATGFSSAAYSVTLPPFPTGNPRDDWRPVLNSELLGRWDVGVVAADYPVDAAGLVEQTSADGVHIYRNTNARPRARVERDDGTWYAADKVDVDAESHRCQRSWARSPCLERERLSWMGSDGRWLPVEAGCDPGWHALARIASRRAHGAIRVPPIERLRRRGDQFAGSVGPGTAVAPTLTASERRWCLIYAAILAGVTTLPYLLGYASQGTTWQFTGFVVGVEDGNSYIAKMLSGAFGAWLFRSPYTTYPQRGILAFLPYLLLGKLAAPPGVHEQLVALFQLLRIGSIPVVVLATYRFAARFLPQEGWRKWVTVMATAGEGLGWILLMVGRTWWLGSLPLDFYSPETFGFLSIFALPHLILARAFLLLGLTAYLDASDAPRKAWQAGWWFAGLGLMQPLSIVSAWAVIGAHGAVISLRALHHWREEAWPRLKLGAIALLVSAPWVAYYALATTTDAYMRQWTAQNRILSPAVPHYLLAYGLILIPALAGVWWVVRMGAQAQWLLVGWAILLPVLAYAPTNLQRRLPEGGWVALAVLAAIALSTSGWPARQARWVGSVILLLSLPSTVLLLGGGMLTALRPGEPAFRPLAEVQAFQWLADHARPRGGGAGLIRNRKCAAGLGAGAGRGWPWPGERAAGTGVARNSGLLRGDPVGRRWAPVPAFVSHPLCFLWPGRAEAREPRPVTNRCAWAALRPGWIRDLRGAGIRGR